MLRAGLAVVLVLSSSVAAAQDGGVAPPTPEIATNVATVKLPAVPSFALAPSEPGFTTPRHLRLQGAKLLGTKVRVKGYVIWSYNCVDAFRTTKETRAEAQKRIDDDPAQCERPKLYLGERKNTALERGVWVVDVPRPPNKLEKARLPAEELAAWPKVPSYKVGDHVVVTGTFATRSPNGEANSDGLVLFESITSAKPSGRAPTLVAATVADDKPVAVEIPRSPALEPVDEKVVNISNIAFNAGNRAYGARDFAEAVKQHKRAVAAWDGNHLAFYGLGSAYVGQRDWRQALSAFESAVALRPDAAMYQMWRGIADYESSVIAAREAEAARQGRPGEYVVIDLSTVSFARARASLEIAVAIEPALWRAHYFLARIHRAAGDARAAARSFSAAITSKPVEQGPYVGLAELYRRWEYTDEAAAVAKLGTEQVRQNEAATYVWFVLGMTHDDRGRYAAAVSAFTRALELKPDNHAALFQRGQANFKLKKNKQAKADLEAFIQISGSSTFAQHQAQKMLVELASRGVK